MTTGRTSWAPVLGAVVALVLTGCGSDDGAGDGGGRAGPELSDTEHNDADVAFATAMIPHHAQALVMVDLTQGRTLDPEVATLAEEIRTAQTPEIESMSDWLVDWGEDVPETMRDHANAHGGGDGMDLDQDMPGMMSAEDLDELEGASDADFQSRWLEMMIEHHEGAVAMAEDEQDAGRYRPAVELAGQIVETQTEEIETMQELQSS